MCENLTKCCGIAISVISIIFHIVLFAAPVWFFCSLTDPLLDEYDNDVNIVYGLFYKVVDYPFMYSYGSYEEEEETTYGEGTHRVPFFQSLEHAPTKARVTSVLYTIMKIQMIISAGLLLRVVSLICQEKKLNENPHKAQWKFFVANWFICGLVGFITQFLGFLGFSLDECPSFLAPYFCMLLSFINFAYFKNVTKKFDKDENPFATNTFKPASATPRSTGTSSAQGRGIQMSTIRQPKAAGLHSGAMNGNHAMQMQFAHGSANPPQEWGMVSEKFEYYRTELIFPLIPLLGISDAFRDCRVTLVLCM
eukprot:gb/GECG01001776.1/.p1 GENE.gb/GECG01001776.1/~~gb/GECG01001776.1/.p1  ORF type:complete len:308 (+),score=23.33 gb/GECG01001776.1/:1-924(+)